MSELEFCHHGALKPWEINKFEVDGLGCMGADGLSNHHEA